MRDLKLRKCDSCGALVKVINDCHCKCEINCCDEIMKEIIPNSVDAAKEKHIPEYSVNDGVTYVRVNHVMDSDHYIEWIALVNDEIEEVHYFKPREEAEVTFNYDKGILYSYCNKHGLWKIEIK